MSEANKNLPKDSVEQLKNKLEAYFLHTTFINVAFLKGEIAKHFNLVENNIMFGTDPIADDYNPEWVGGWIARDNAIYEKLGVTEEQKQKLHMKFKNKNKERFYKFRRLNGKTQNLEG